MNSQQNFITVENKELIYIAGCGFLSLFLIVPILLSSVTVTVLLPSFVFLTC